jgi:hypothetical protein
MKIAACASAIALATSLLLSNVSTGAAVEYSGTEALQLATSVNIDRIKSALKLTPAQERFWPAVEGALRDLGRQQAKTSDQDGIVRRLSRRVVSVVLNTASVQRLAAAAKPLIAALDDDQKRVAVGLAQEMGLGPVVAALY